MLMNPFAAISVLAALSTMLAFSWSTTTTKLPAPGVTLTQEAQTSPPLLASILTIDPSTTGVTVAPEVANGSLTAGTGDIRKGRENVSSLARREKLLAAVNGDYFPYTGDPLGLGVSDSEIYSEPYRTLNVPGRAAIGWLSDGRAIVGIPALDATLTSADGSQFAITGIDRMTATDNPNDLVLTTSRFGPHSGARGNGAEVVLSSASPLPVTPGRTISAKVAAIITNSPDPATLPAGGLIVSAPSGGAMASRLASKFHVGDSVTVRIDLRDITPNAIGAAEGGWDSVREAIGGGPILLRDGRAIVDGDAEGFSSSFVDGRHARTAVGVRSDGKLVIVAIDESSSLSQGITLPDLALFLRGLGVVDAINLDGGGSTTMVVDGMTIDFPQGSQSERPVADMLTVSVKSDPPSPVGQPLSISTQLNGLQIGDVYPLTLRENGLLVSGAQDGVIWNGPVGGVGFVTQDGSLHVLHAGHGTITAMLNGAIASTEITVGSAASPASPTPARIAPAAQPGPSEAAPENGQEE